MRLAPLVRDLDHDLRADVSTIAAIAHLLASPDAPRGTDGLAADLATVAGRLEDRLGVLATVITTLEGTP